LIKLIREETLNMPNIPVSREQGISLYLAILIMTILLSIGLGVSTILLGQMKMLRGMGDSVVAFYAADTGIEEILYTGVSSSSGTLENGARYEATMTLAGPGCSADYYCIRSVGIFQATRRAIEVTR